MSDKTKAEYVIENYNLYKEIRELKKELRELKERNSKGFLARLKDLFGAKVKV